MRQYSPTYEPSPEEIAEACQVFQERWSDEERLARRWINVSRPWFENPKWFVECKSCQTLVVVDETQIGRVRMCRDCIRELWCRDKHVSSTSPHSRDDWSENNSADQEPWWTQIGEPEC